jgi:hypothetical protein
VTSLLTGIFFLDRGAFDTCPARIVFKRHGNSAR